MATRMKGVEELMNHAAIDTLTRRLDRLEEQRPNALEHSAPLFF